MAGEAAKGTKGFASEKNEVEEVPCIVKFRPCTDWRGEYGFDWVREGSDDYKERIGNIKYYPTEVYMTEFLRKKLGKDKEGRDVYDSLMEKKKRELLRQQESERKNKLKSLGFVYRERNTLSPDNEDELTNYIYDLYAKHHKVDDYSQMNSEDLNFDRLNENANIDVVEAITPLEYFYLPRDVHEVSYRIRRKDKEHKKVWLMERISYENMFNGDEEAEHSENKNLIMNHFAIVSAKKQSMILNDNGSFTIPIYLDEPIFANSPASGISTQQGQQPTSGTKTTKMVIINIGKNKIELRYSFDNQGIRVLLATIMTKTEQSVEAVWFAYIDGKLRHVGNGIKNDFQIPRYYPDMCFWSEEDRDRHLIQFDKKGLRKRFISTDMINNKNIDVFHLSQDEAIDEAYIQIVKPNDYCMVDVSNNCEEKDGNWFWGGYHIYSWKEDYEDSFHIFPSARNLIKLKEKDKPYKYCVPILSIGNNNRRTRFEFAEETDAPRKIKEASNCFRIQIHKEGACDKLRLRPNHRSITIEENKGEIISPKEWEEITVKYNPSEDCLVMGNVAIDDSFIQKKIVAYNVYNDEYGREKEVPVGELDINIEKKRTLKTVFVKIILGTTVRTKHNHNRFRRDPFSQGLSDCLKDQKDAVANAMGQKGIDVEIVDYELRMEKSHIADFKQGNSYNYNFYDASQRRWVNLGERFLDALLSDAGFRNNIELQYEPLCFFFDGSFADNTIAYAYMYKDFSYVVSSKYIGSNRTNAYTIAHELLHRLRLTHSFQLIGKGYLQENAVNTEKPTSITKENDYCWPIASTSNIMDYYRLAYSLNKMQWEQMEQALDIHNEWVKDKVNQQRHELA